MRKITFLAACAAASAFSAPAMAADGDEGRLQVKVLATGVLPNGKIDKIKSVLPSVATALGANPGTRANDNIVPTLAIEYYATPNVSVETICCFTSHHVTGTGSVAGANLVKHVMILPATVTVKYHLDAGPIRPYVGAGPALFLVFDEKPGSTARALGVTSVKMSNSLGLALQGGVDVPLDPANSMGVTLDAKRYFMKPTAKFYAGSTLALETRHKLDPWVVSGGVYFRF
jgi:outer membrane protein